MLEEEWEHLPLEATEISNFKSISIGGPSDDSLELALLRRCHGYHEDVVGVAQEGCRITFLLALHMISISSAKTLLYSQAAAFVNLSASGPIPSICAAESPAGPVSPLDSSLASAFAGMERPCSS